MISIIIPIYNSEDYLDECFESIQVQTFTDFEVIMVNDGSYDNSENICKKWTKLDSRFKYFYKENGGFSDSRNFGFTKASGDYIFYLDSDDFISPQTLDFLYKTIISDDLDLVACYEYDFVDGDRPEMIRYNDVKIRKYLDNIEYLKTFTYEDLIIARTWNKLYKRELIKDIKFEDYIMEDRIFNIELAPKINKAAIINNKLIYHRFHENSIMTTKSAAIYSGMCFSCKKHAHCAKMLARDEKEFKGINEQIILILNKYAAAAHAEHFPKEEYDLRKLSKQLFKENGVNKLSIKLFLQMYLYRLWMRVSINRSHIWIGGRNMKDAQ